MCGWFVIRVPGDWIPLDARLPIRGQWSDRRQWIRKYIVPRLQSTTRLLACHDASHCVSWRLTSHFMTHPLARHDTSPRRSWRLLSRVMTPFLECVFRTNGRLTSHYTTSPYNPQLHLNWDHRNLVSLQNHQSLKFLTFIHSLNFTIKHVISTHILLIFAICSGMVVEWGITPNWVETHTRLSRWWSARATWRMLCIVLSLKNDGRSHFCVRLYSNCWSLARKS